MRIHDPLGDTETLRRGFLSLRSGRDLARLLAVPYSSVIYHVRVTHSADRYTRFELKKRRGGVREILAPGDALKFLQQRLNQVLQAAYEPKRSAHGFVPERSILTNASVHVGRKYTLNVDLEDFFPSIHFGRVRGVFLKQPFNLPEEVATLLAQICCHDGKLPQGAPTSPVVSNLVCRRLDNTLARLARRYRCAYTRYADDITLSSNATSFPAPLAAIPEGLPPNGAALGDALRRAIEENDFRINVQKVRLTRRWKERCEVTGLVVNETVNVRRRFLRQIRAMLHAWRKFGFDEAQRTYHDSYLTKHHAPGRNLPAFDRVVRGKIDFLGSIRGRTDPTYCSLLRQYADLAPGFPRDRLPTPVPRGERERAIFQALWVLEDDDAQIQGSAFLLENVGLVTCAHVVAGSTVDAFRPHEPCRPFRATVARRDDERDLAVLELPDSALEGTAPLRQGPAGQRRRGDHVYVAGCANYRRGDEPQIYPGVVAAFRTERLERRLLVSAPIVAGMSGGPVLDESNCVIGVAAKGGATESDAAATEDRSVIPVDAIYRIGAPPT